MIQLNIEDKGKTFNIVNSYNELTLGQYIDIMKVSEKKLISNIEADIEIISVLCDDITKSNELKELLNDFDITDFEELKKAFEWVVTDIKTMEEFKSITPNNSIFIDGEEYSLYSNYSKKMTLGEVISFETIMAQEQSDLSRYDIAFGVLLRPIKDGKPVEFTEEVFNDVISKKYKVKMIDIYAALSFFLSGEKISITKNTKRFSIQTK